MKTLAVCSRIIGGLADRRILAVAAVIALLFVWGIAGSAQPQTAGDLYKVTMTNVGAWGVNSNCPALDGTTIPGYVLLWNNRGNLQSNQSALPDESVAPLNLNLLTDVPWTRRYDVGRGTSDVFGVSVSNPTGCFGETGAGPGALFITFGKTKKGPTVSFRWNFDFYEYRTNKIRETIQENFFMTSGAIQLLAPAVAWTGQDTWTARVAGNFDLQYYLKADGKFATQSLTGGQGRYFVFDLVIEKCVVANNYCQ